MKNVGAHVFVISRRMMLGVVVGAVVGTGLPVEVELFGADAVDEPMVAHVERFGAFHTDLGAEDTESGGVVCLEGSAGGRLGVPHFGEGGDYGNRLLGVEEEGTGLSLGSGGSNGTDRFTKDMDSGVGGGSRGQTDSGGESGEKKIARGTTASVREDEVRGVGANR